MAFLIEFVELFLSIFWMTSFINIFHWNIFPTSSVIRSHLSTLITFIKAGLRLKETKQKKNQRFVWLDNERNFAVRKMKVIAAESSAQKRWDETGKRGKRHRTLPHRTRNHPCKTWKIPRKLEITCNLHFTQTILSLLKTTWNRNPLTTTKIPHMAKPTARRGFMKKKKEKKTCMWLTDTPKLNSSDRFP